MAIAFKWYGDKILKDVEKQSKELLTLVAVDIAGKARKLCPYRTGNLRRSIRHVMLEDRARVYAGGDTPGVAAPVEYAGFVELGTSKMAAQPYLRPAVESFSRDDLDRCVNKVKEK